MYTSEQIALFVCLLARARLIERRVTLIQSVLTKILVPYLQVSVFTVSVMFQV